MTETVKVADPPADLAALVLDLELVAYGHLRGPAQIKGVCLEAATEIHRLAVRNDRAIERMEEYRAECDALRSTQADTEARLKQVEQERDFWRTSSERVDGYARLAADDLVKMEVRAIAAEAQLAEARRHFKAITTYKRHSSSCAQMLTGERCDCGRVEQYLAARTWLSDSGEKA